VRGSYAVTNSGIKGEKSEKTMNTIRENKLIKEVTQIVALCEKVSADCRIIFLFR